MIEIKEKVSSEIYKIEEVLSEKWNKREDISLMIGKGGILLFYDSLYRLTKDSRYLAETEKILENIFDTINKSSNQTNYNFCTGLSGLAYSFDLLSRTDSMWEEQLSETLLVFDRLISDYIMNRIYSINEIDFLHGSLGISLYLNERIKMNPRIQNTTEIIFEKTCQVVSDFFIHLGSLERDEAIESFAFGLAHGCASIIVLLSKALNSYPTNKAIRKTLTSVIDHLLKFKSNDLNDLSIFPSNLLGKIGYCTPLSWCRGDQGIAHSLFIASECLEDASLQNEANDIATRITRRSTLEKSVFSIENCSTGLCHGIPSIAYLHKRLFLHTGNSDFLNLYNVLTKELLQKSNHYLDAEEPDGFQTKKMTPDITLLNGITGVGLFYIDFLTNEAQSKWEGIFLLD